MHRFFEPQRKTTLPNFRALIPALALFAASCSGEKSTPAESASATKPAAATPAKTDAPPAKSVDSVVSQTVDAAKAEGEKATTAAAAAMKAGEQNVKSAAASAEQAIKQAAADTTAHSANDGHDHSHDDGHDHDHDHAAENKAPGAVVDAKDRIDALLKGQNPQENEVDPNSKARLSYEFGSDNKNFGKAMQGDVLKHTFQLKSDGEEDLIIKQAKPTCGCTVAQVQAEGDDGTMQPYTYGNPIKPGKKVELQATLHTANKHGHAASRINIFSNDPRGQSQLGLEADVETFFLVNPQSINFTQLSAKDTATDKVSVSTAKGQRVKLASVLNNLPPGLKLELNPLDADADGAATRWELIATAGPGLVEGPLAYSVPLKSDVPLPGAETAPGGTAPTYEASVTIMGQVMGTISYNPSFVSLGLIRPGQVVTRTVRIVCHDTEFKLGEPKVTVSGRDGGEWEYTKHFTSVARAVPNENAVDVELRLEGMPDTLNGSFAGTMTVQVGYPDKPEIKLPITGVCRGGAANATPVSGGAPK